jgi:hypothetical protein
MIVNNIDRTKSKERVISDDKPAMPEKDVVSLLMMVQNALNDAKVNIGLMQSDIQKLQSTLQTYENTLQSKLAKDNAQMSKIAGELPSWISYVTTPLGGAIMFKTTGVTAGLGILLGAFEIYQQSEKLKVVAFKQKCADLQEKAGKCQALISFLRNLTTYSQNSLANIAKDQSGIASATNSSLEAIGNSVNYALQK